MKINLCSDELEADGEILACTHKLLQSTMSKKNRNKPHKETKTFLSRSITHQSLI